MHATFRDAIDRVLLVGNAEYYSDDKDRRDVAVTWLNCWKIVVTNHEFRMMKLNC